jgi:hypothetical protein
LSLQRALRTVYTEAVTLQTYAGSCHCGAVRFEVDLELDHVRVWDCSICRKRGALNHRAAVMHAVAWITRTLRRRL